MNRIIILVFFISLNIYGQVRIQGRSGLNYPVFVDGYEVELFRYWKIGLNTGVSADIQIMNMVSLKPTIGYHYYLFNEFIQEVVAGSKAINSKGKGSQIINVGSDICIDGKRTNNTFPYFVVGVGYAVEKPGKMTITWKRTYNNDIYTSEYRVQERSYWYYSAGFGYEYSIAQDIDIKMSIDCYFNKVDAPTKYRTYNLLWFLNCSVVYDIIEL